MNPESRSQIRHDLRTALNHIVGYSEILLADAKEYKRQDLLPDIEHLLTNCEAIRELINRYFAPNAPTNNPGELTNSFFGPTIQIITDARRLVALYRQKAPGFVRDMEQLLSVANEMYDLIDTTWSDHQTAAVTAAGAALGPAKTVRRPPVEAAIPDFNDNEFPDSIAGTRAKIPGRILVIDDSQASQDLLSRHLRAQGHTVDCASSGPEALAFLGQTPEIDVIFLDVLIPQMSGVEILRALRSDSRFQDIPVIMISALDSSASIAHCIKLGAEDYLPKDFDAVILRARLDACLEKKRLSRQQEVFVQALIRSQETLAHELADAGRYVVSLLPKPIDKPFKTSIALIPSAELGGDFCSFHQLDEQRWSIYLLDVSGHGIKSALLAVTISNILKNQALPGTDFQNPAAVLYALNANFQASEASTIYFTMWYGVFNTVKRSLVFASAGAPPACLIHEGAIHQLGTKGLLLGATTEVEYANEEVTVTEGDRLFLFSDGIYESTRQSGSMIGIADFSRFLPRLTGDPKDDLAGLCTTILGMTGKDYFDDDVCVLEAVF